VLPLLDLLDRAIHVGIQSKDGIEAGVASQLDCYRLLPTLRDLPSPTTTKPDRKKYATLHARWRGNRRAASRQSPAS
jgi:hypothetical protein